MNVPLKKGPEGGREAFPQFFFSICIFQYSEYSTLVNAFITFVF